MARGTPSCHPHLFSYKIKQSELSSRTKTYRLNSPIPLAFCSYTCEVLGSFSQGPERGRGRQQF